MWFFAWIFICRKTISYSEIQKEIADIFTNMISFVRTSDFNTYITENSPKMKNLEKKLTANRKDVVKTDCPVVICGKAFFKQKKLIHFSSE